VISIGTIGAGRYAALGAIFFKVAIFIGEGDGKNRPQLPFHRCLKIGCASMKFNGLPQSKAQVIIKFIII